jgi:hypothetical protein
MTRVGEAIPTVLKRPWSQTVLYPALSAARADGANVLAEIKRFLQVRRPPQFPPFCLPTS